MIKKTNIWCPSDGCLEKLEIRYDDYNKIEYYYCRKCQERIERHCKKCGAELDVNISIENNGKCIFCYRNGGWIDEYTKSHHMYRKSYKYR